MRGSYFLYFHFVKKKSEIRSSSKVGFVKSFFHQSFSSNFLSSKVFSSKSFVKKWFSSKSVFWSKRCLSFLGFTFFDEIPFCRKPPFLTKDIFFDERHIFTKGTFLTTPFLTKDTFLRKAPFWRKTPIYERHLFDEKHLAFWYFSSNFDETLSPTKRWRKTLMKKSDTKLRKEKHKFFTWKISLDIPNKDRFPMFRFLTFSYCKYR